MTNWRTSFYDQDLGDPQALQRGPDVEVVRAAGCPRVAKALQRARQLRDEYVGVRTQLRGREQALAEARTADARAHAQDLTRELEPPT